MNKTGLDKTGIIAVALCLALLGWWTMRQRDQQLRQQAQQALFQATNIVAQTQAQPAATNGAASAATPASSPTLTFDTNAPEQTLVLNCDRARYTFTSRGGGLQRVDLLNYPETISARWRGRVTNSAAVASLNTLAAIPALAVLGEGLTGDGNFAMTSTAAGVRMEKALPGGLRLIKTFSVASNYLIQATIRMENSTAQPLNLPAQEVVAGTATPMDVDDNGMMVGAMWSDGVRSQNQPLAWFSGGGFGCSRGAPRPEFRAGEGNVFWVAAHNQFFAMVAMLQTNEPARQMVARLVTLPRFQNVGTVTDIAEPHGLQTTLEYPALTLAPGAAVERNITLYAGPKEYRRLVAISRQFGNNVDQVMNFGSGYLAFWGIGTFFAKLLLSAMNGLHDLTGWGYGWLIVVLTILIKAVFWPLMARSTRSMKRMQLLAPELAALKEKYKDDQQKMMQKTWALYKEHKVNPMSGCLPMIIQMPVFLGFFTMLRNAIELRGASFLWAADLTKPDTLFVFQGIPFNLLPLLMGGVMLWQTHLQPPSPGMDPAQQKMMRYMPLLFLLFLYNYSAGMSLYMIVSTLASVVQTKVTKITLAKDTPPAGPAGPAVIPALTPASKKKK